jgi:hypothetical protein
VTAAVRRLRAALAAVVVEGEAPELALVHRWLDNWHGVGLLAVGCIARATISTCGSTATVTGA